MEPENIEYNGIEYESKSLIQFSSLTRLLFDIAKRQKELENKYEYINENVLDKEQRVSDLEIKVLGESKSNNKNKFDNDSFSKQYNQKSQLNYDYIKRENNSEIIYNGEKSGSKEEMSDSINENKNNSDAISKINNKIKGLEKKLDEINIKTNKDISLKIIKNEDNINKNNSQINQLDKNYGEINKKLNKFNEELDKIKIKVEDFNIYDIFKNNSGEGGADPNMALVMNLENKIFKKFSLYDEKNKKNESDLFKILEELKNLKALIDDFKVQNQRNNEKIGEIDKNLKDYINKNDNNKEELENNLELLIEQKIKKLNSNEITKEFDKKIKKIEEDLKNIINEVKLGKQADNNINDNIFKKKMVDLDKTIKDIKKNISELDKNVNQNITNVDSSLKEKISLLEKEIQKKANITDLNIISDKIYGLEELTKELNTQVESLQKFNDKFKSELTNFNKKLEYLNSLFVDFKSDLENNKTHKTKEIDKNNFISQDVFNEYKKENNTKNEKIRGNLEEISRNLNDILSSLNKYTSNKEFVQFQNNILSLIEEFKISCFKKFMDKHEINKNLRILENEIKSLSDKKMDGADKWLLAKKPLNNYQCASCEAMLKDLEQTDNFVAWNKYPNREDKTYRMGHGFSRMLQMVNEEIIKNIENKESKGYVSDEDKRANNNRSKYNDSSYIQENKSIKLPKVPQKNINNDKYGLTVNKVNRITSPYEDFDSASPDEPKISKIYKINNNGKKLFGLNKTTTTENKNNLSVNSGERNFAKFKDNNKIDYLQMSMTQLNEKQ